MEDGRWQQLQWSWHVCIVPMAADAHISGGHAGSQPAVQLNP